MINPKSMENLQPFDRMDREKHREICSKGGKASAQKRRDTKKQADMIVAIMRYKEFFKTLYQLMNMDREEIEQLIEKISDLQ